MILQALNRYYEILVNDPQSGIAPPGYSSANVSFALNLSADGKLVGIFPLFETVLRGKKTMEVPRRMIVPEQVKRSSGISANFLCDNGAYVLGLSGKEGKDPDYAIKRFEAFRKLNINLLAKADCTEARAVSAFLENYDPKADDQKPTLATELDRILKGGNLVFRLESGTGFVHEHPEIQRIWELEKAESEAKVGQCLVTGEIGPIARLHPSLKGVAETNSTGATLVGFNAPAYESYNRTKGQGLNSPVSEKAAFAYTTALNYLLSRENENRKFTMGDTTIVYWAESRDPSYGKVFLGLFGMEPEPEKAEEETRSRDKKAERLLRNIADKVRRAEGLDTAAMMEGLNPETRFYVLGLAPNAARISVRFFHSDPFQKIIEKIMAHYRDLQIEREYDNQPELIPLWRLLQETYSKKSADKKASPLLAGAIMRAILLNAPYPAAMYYALITRIRADMDDSGRQISKINYIRAAMIKAYLTRKYRNQEQSRIKEVLCMSLNELSTNQAYLLGRLFAVLEKAQKDAIPGDIATIKDRYFTSACAAPRSTFPVLLRLAQHHIAKAEYGYTSDRRVEQIMQLLDVEQNPFPAHLTLDEQGIFVLGYYHQRAAFYVPRANNLKTEEETSETN
jgi:CRISPR-associated protein Csd1